MRRRRFVHKPGQALVEFALAATLIFFLLAAAVDLGLIYFTVQGMHNAAQEGANYGSRWLIVDPSTEVRKLDEPAIRDRVRKEAGAKGGIGFVNLLDLNGNGVTDDKEPAVLQNYITIQLLADKDRTGNPLKDADNNPVEVPCANPAVSTVPCYVRVIVKMDYKPVFALSPVLGEKVSLNSSYFMPIRDSAAEGGIPQPGLNPVFQQDTR